MNTTELIAAASAAYNKVSDCRKHCLSLLDSKGRPPANKARRALYDAACEAEQQAFRQWVAADHALLEVLPK